MGAHARFSPSAANRLIHCPPSLVLGEAFQEEESPYAAEGSAGHALAEHLIKKHLKQQTRRPVSDYYSDDLLEAVDDYVSFVIGETEEAKRQCADSVFSVEQKVDICDYVPDCFGTKGCSGVCGEESTADDLRAWRVGDRRDAVPGGDGTPDYLSAKTFQFQHLGDYSRGTESVGR